ncbi:pyrroloquinoline quinone biosynthesis protein PqqB [Acidisoma cellulosilytica]|uniref:Coenzyme PQQ synthesis protein B n=1 Tax=Acidisoma cellulosilyticum TaxID=2802395 RepID=A0A964E1Y1_9PROT|nr:pyrroloquinoline quinone biosynthesis protein PqqB [Acidisoma cellulosilyticum]MCB8878836.1 pyrroloquinoline quinone biosynthesis protein PqqB [Acidisoma cellulosilyticum]
MISIIVLGAAAGGGFPQWNSNAVRCQRARSADPMCPSQSQAGLAVSADRRHWFLLNASPDLRQQIFSAPVLHPQEGLRSSPIAGVILTAAEVDTVTGLLCLRERHTFDLYAASPVQDVLAANPIFNALNAAFVTRHTVESLMPFPLRHPDGRDSGLIATLFPVPGKVPLFLETEGRDVQSDDDVMGLELSDGDKLVVFIPGCAHMTDAVRSRLQDADLVFFDGTLWDDDEMIRAGLGPKTGRRMGHMPVSGDGGTLDAFAAISVGRKILIHINNSNPILDRASPEYAAVLAAGWDVAFDGMTVQL